MKGVNGPDGSFNADSVTFGRATARAEETPTKKHPNSLFSKGANIDPYINGLNFGDDIKASDSVTQKGDSKFNVTKFSYEKDGKTKTLASVIVTPDGKTKYVETGKVMYKANMDGEITDVLTGKEKKAQHLALFGKPRSTKGSCESQKS